MKASKLLLLLVILVGVGPAKGDSSSPMCGIGVVVRPDAGPATSTILVLNHLDIVQMMPGGPGEKSGLQKGDEITQVNGISVAGMNFVYVVTKLIRGSEGTPVTITIKRNGIAGLQSFTIIREPVTVPPNGL